MALYQIVITVQVEAKSIQYIRDEYLKKEYPNLPDCTGLDIYEVDDEDTIEVIKGDY